MLRGFQFSFAFISACLIHMVVEEVSTAYFKNLSKTNKTNKAQTSRANKK